MTISIKELLVEYDKGAEFFLAYIDNLNKNCKSAPERKKIERALDELSKKRINSDHHLIEHILDQATIDFKYFKYYSEIVLEENKNHILSGFFEGIRRICELNFFDGKIILYDLKIARYIFGACNNSLSKAEKEHAVSLKDQLTSWIIKLPPKKDALACRLINIASNQDAEYKDKKNQLSDIFNTQRGLFATSLFFSQKSCLGSLTQNLKEREERIEHEIRRKSYEEKDQLTKLTRKEATQDRCSTISIFNREQNSRLPPAVPGYSLAPVKKLGKR